MPADSVHVGTSGWTYDDWAGRFYPQGVTGVKRLEYYAQHFDTVEVNATFYRLPSATLIGSWNRRLPEGFHLVVKGSRLITHLKRLRGCEDALGTFLARVAELRCLRVILWQLPPSLQRDLPLLEAFLAQLTGPARHALEFRHSSWWHDEVSALLARYGAAFVAVSHPDLPGQVLPTTDFLYLRFHGMGPRRYDYDYSEAELREWVQRAASHQAGRTLYAFFNNDYRAQAPANAETFRALLGRN
ncbi:MAG TPA: DUF72 domain-containing protein [bacterium]|nr:DUF72 domain-containing protein [bacterium]